MMKAKGFLLAAAAVMTFSSMSAAAVLGGVLRRAIATVAVNFST